jgi:hypothetical protein
VTEGLQLFYGVRNCCLSDWHLPKRALAFRSLTRQYKHSGIGRRVLAILHLTSKNESKGSFLIRSDGDHVGSKPNESSHLHTFWGYFHLCPVLSSAQYLRWERVFFPDQCRECCFAQHRHSAYLLQYSLPVLLPPRFAYPIQTMTE